MIIPRRIPIPKRVPPNPWIGPPRERKVDPEQVDLVAYLEAHPAAAANEAVDDGPSLIEDKIEDGPSYADHAVRAAPRDANGAFLPRPVPRITLPLIVQIARLGQALHGKTWIGRVAADVGQHERQMRRWANWEGRPPAVVFTRLKAAAERQIARIRTALDPAGGMSPTGSGASESADAPHVGPSHSVAEALALHIKERKAALVHPPQAPRKPSRVDQP